MKFFSSPRPFWLNLVLIVGAVTLIGVIWFLFAQNPGAISNAYFLGAFLLWIAALVPAFDEVSGNVKIRTEARKAGKDAKPMIQAAEEKYQKGGRTTFLFGLAGFICFILAFLSLAL
ncbi:MAG: hypothetical protein HUU38_30245 [Anaerolineales bacterium]|jgi:hypothetical protein|nr:hypothetical protein [Anaerolineales bacterium]